MGNKGEGGAAALTRRALLAGGGAAALGGCARSRDPDALAFWAMSYEGDWSPLLMPPFTAATGIPVETQSLPWTEAHEKLLTAHAGGDLPDVMMLPNGWVGEFAMIGAIAPVTDASLLADTLPGVLDTTRHAGRDYAVPWAMGPLMQYYRRDLLAEAGYAAPPADWLGWKAMAHALKRRRPDEYPLLLLLNWWDVLFTFAGQVAAWPLRARDTRGNFATPQFRAALAFYVSLFAEGLAPRVLSTEVQDPFAAFAQGHYAVYPYGSELLFDFKRRVAEIAPDRWAVARMPGPRGPAGASNVSSSLAVSARSTRPDAAWALVCHLTSERCELQFQRWIGKLPARASAWNSVQMCTPDLRPFAEQVRTPAPTPTIVEWERIRSEVQLVAEKVVRDLLTIDEGLAEMDRRVDRLLAKRRELVAAGRLA